MPVQETENDENKGMCPKKDELLQEKEKKQELHTAQMNNKLDIYTQL